MNALLVLYAGNLSPYALEPLENGKNSLMNAVERAQRFPMVQKTVILAGSGGDFSEFSGIQIEKRPVWTVKILLDTISELSHDFDFCYFAWADCPFLDPVLAGKQAERHLCYAAEYSYADGWPYGFAPELLSKGTAAILAGSLNESDGGPVKRDSLFTVIQKDINAFDIETEISSVDLRCHRLSLCADSRRNLLLLRRFADGGIPSALDSERIISERPGILRTLPAFYPVQVSGGCPQSCIWCPWSQAGKTGASAGAEVTARRDFMEPEKFTSLLDKIIAFSGDAVIDLSLWGELSLHPCKLELIEQVLCRPELSLVIETSGIGWKTAELEHCAELVKKYRKNPGDNPSALSWIVSLDTADPVRYSEIRGAGFAEANDCARRLFTLFRDDVYVQAIRTVGAEDDTERFYRFWKEIAPDTKNIIIQKYDDFCGALSRKQASDLSPVLRQPCWHLMRDMPVLLDGAVPLCREQIAHNISAIGDSFAISPGNAFSEPLDVIWERGQPQYSMQLCGTYNSLCAKCDEYYTYNF